MDKELVLRINKLEQKYNRLKKILFGSILIIVISSLTLGFTAGDKFNIIRAKGIIIEDSNGKDRILIGSPIPFSKDRIRTDTVKAKKHWASSFGSESKNYMKYYKDYNHSTEGIVIMNEEGFDRVLLGDKLADPNTGKKMFQSAGITWNDKMGWELGGAGVNTGADGKARAVIGLDDPKNNSEAVHLVALEDGTKALIIGGESGRLVIGLNDEKSDFLKTKEKFSGIKYFDHQGELIWEQKVPNKE